MCILEILTIAVLIGLMLMMMIGGKWFEKEWYE